MYCSKFFHIGACVLKTAFIDKDELFSDWFLYFIGINIRQFT